MIECFVLELNLLQQDRKVVPVIHPPVDDRGLQAHHSLNVSNGTHRHIVSVLESYIGFIDLNVRHLTY